jgi:CheY-like chemotaxis protein
METILVVDREPIIRSFIRHQVEGHCEILEATSPMEVLDICRTHPGIDLLICDADLGLVSGMELASLIRAWNSKLRTILTSDVPCDCWTQRQETELGELPPDDVLILERPFTSKELKAAVTSLMQQDVQVVGAV